MQYISMSLVLKLQYYTYDNICSDCVCVCVCVQYYYMYSACADVVYLTRDQVW